MPTISTDSLTVNQSAESPQSPAEMRRTALYLTLAQVPAFIAVAEITTYLARHAWGLPT